MKTLEEIKTEYPLHWYVWQNNVDELQESLKTDQFEKEKVDPRGCTPLMLAVKLCHLQCVKCLLAAKCNAMYEFDGWSVVQEAVCTGDEDMLTAILEVRDLQRHVQRIAHVPRLLQHLLDAPDFYVEMKWEFTSWVPLMSRFCPSDTYTVYKRGANVRIDTTLLGFDNNTWQRGNRSYIFKRLKETALMIEIDHDRQEIIVEDMCNDVGDVVAIAPPKDAVKARLNTPVITNNIEMDKINFERNKSGIWGWRSEKTDVINNFNCKVYGASNVDFVTRTRMDHLSEEQIKSKTFKTPFHNFLGLADEDYSAVLEPERTSKRDNADDGTSTAVSCQNNITENTISHGNSETHLNDVVTPQEYFSSDVNLNGRDIGKHKKINTKIQRFKANLWLCGDYPIRLQEQVIPILDLMSTMASPHVSKLKDFITMQLPAGFPVKIEIPLFHVFNACITFGNVFGMTTPVKYVSTIKEDDRITCLVDDCCFEVPFHYTEKGSNSRHMTMSMDEDDILQYAIAESLRENNNKNPNVANDISVMENPYDKVDIWEALRGRNTISHYLTEEDEHIQRVLQESLSEARFTNTSTSNLESDSNINIHCIDKNNDDNDNDDASFKYIEPNLAMALRISQREQEQYELERKREEEMLEQALKLSLQDN